MAFAELRPARHGEQRNRGPDGEDERDAEREADQRIHKVPKRKRRPHSNASAAKHAKFPIERPCFTAIGER